MINRLRLRAVFHKELLHILRDWRSLTLAIALPVVLLLMFGYALTLDVDRIPTQIYDQDGTPESRTMVQRFAGSRYFSLKEPATSALEIQKNIDDNRVLLGVVIPDDFARDLRSGREAKVQLIVDGSDSNTASLALSYAETVVQLHAVELQNEMMSRRGLSGIKQPVDPRIRVLYNNDMKSRNFIVPGLIALILMIISALLTSLTIAREWENGTMEQLLSTPLRPTELLLGKLSAFFLVGAADILVALIIGIGLFRVPMRGSALLLAAVSCVFLFGALCWGILISTIAKNQLMAYQMGLLSSFLPAFLLSGFVFSIENMPLVIQVVTYIVPARYFVTILKGIFLKGAGLTVLWSDLAFLMAYGVIVFSLAVRKLRQKVA